MIKIKKLLSFLLCITLLTTTMGDLNLLADNNTDLPDEAIALIEAWSKLGYEESTVIAYANGAQKTENIPDSLNLTDEQKKLMGTHYKEFSGVGDITNWSDFPYAYKTFSEFSKITFSVYAENSGICLESGFGLLGSDNIYYNYFGANKKGFFTVNATNNFAGLLNSNAKANGYRCHYYSGTGKLYVGSVLGWKQQTIQLPEDIYDIPLHQLYSKAAEIDIKDYTLGVEDFEAAKEAFYNWLNANGFSDAVNIAADNLLKAWKNLSNISCTTIDYPSVAKPISELPTNLDLSDEQIKKLGSHYYTVNGGTNLIDWNNIAKLTKKYAANYDKITTVFYSPSYTGYVGLYVGDYTSDTNIELYRGNIGYTYSYGANENLIVYTNKFQEVNITSKADKFATQGAIPNGYRLEFETNYANTGATVYVGSIVGWKTVYATDIPDAESVTIQELITAAKKVNINDYNIGVTEFETALKVLWETAYPEAAKLISAWENLKGTFATTIDFPSSAKPISELPLDLDLSDEQIEKLGSHYYTINGGTNLMDWNNSAKFTKKYAADYDKITTVFYSPSYTGFVGLYIGDYKSDTTIELYRGNIGYTHNYGTGDNFVVYTNKFQEVDLTAKADKFATQVAVPNGYRLDFETNYTNTGATVYVGSIVGWKKQSAQLPKDIYDISLRQLYLKAAEIDVTDYTEGVQEFVAARDTLFDWLNANGFLDSENVATDNLLKAWKDIANDTKVVKDIIAVPTPEIRIKVNENTIIEDLSDTTVLGGYYADKYKWSNGTALGWNSSISHTLVTSGFNFSEYEDIYFYLSAYDVNSNPTQVKIVTQLNGVYNDEATGTGWYKVPFSKQNEDAHYIKFLCLEGSIAYVSFGSVIGEKIVKGATLPADYEKLSLEQLVTLASDVDTNGFKCGNNFDSALKEAKSVIGELDINISNKNGVVTGKPDSFYYSDKINLLATANGGYKFDGWYIENQLICETKEYSFVASFNANINAKFIAIKGDITLDNKVNALDLAGLQKIIFKDINSTEHADINSDSFVDIIDLVKLKKKLVTELDKSNFITVDSRALSGNKKEITNFKLLTTKPKAFNLVEFKLNTPNLSDELNVYLEDDVDITMTLSDSQGKSLVVDAFYFEEYETNEEKRLINIATGENGFRIRVNPKSSGIHSFKVTLAVKGVIVDELNGFIDIADNDEGSDLLKVEPNRKQTFITESGKDYVAIGENVAWNYPVTNKFDFSKYITEYMDVLAENGANYVRIWDYVYTGGSIKSGVNQMSQTASAMWDKIFESAEQSGIYISFVLLNHGELSQTNGDASFNATCWYENNGGYLADANNFYSDARTMSALKTYIRYIVSRWGYSENLMTWEICNELDHAVGTNDKQTIISWLEEVASYLREQDPYDHMVSNSPGRFDSPYANLEIFDFIYYHMYNYDISSALWPENLDAVLYFQKNIWQTYQRPILIGEWGIDLGRGIQFDPITEDLAIVHHGNWVGVMGGGAGTAMNFYWDDLNDLGGEKSYQVISDVAKQIPWSDANMSMVKTTDISPSNSQIGATGYRGNDYAYIWFFDEKYLATNLVEKTFNNTTASVSINNGTYKVSWVDTRTGESIKEEILTVENGKLSFTMPSWSKDVLLTVEAN